MTESRDVLLTKKHDMLICPKCQFSMILTDESPLGRYVETWKNHAEDIFPILRPEMVQSDLSNPRLFFLYEDCYHSLLIGRYNASIVLMGVLLEALMKERIMLKLGIDYHKPYGPCLNVIERNKLMDIEHIHFLRKFKDEVRNPYQHADDAAILKDLFTPVWRFEFKELDPKKLLEFIRDARSGRIKPTIVPVADLPEIRAIQKQYYDRERAIELFNRVCDFLRDANIKYFKQEDYEEHHRKFGSKLNSFKFHKI